MSKKTVKKVLFLLLTLNLIGCSKPKQEMFEEKPVEAPDFITDRPVDITDPDIGVASGSKATASEAKPASILAYTEESSNYFADVNLIYNYAKENKLTTVQSRVRANLAALYKSGKHTSQVRFADSPFAELFIAQAEPKFLEATKDLKNMFDWQEHHVISLLTEAHNAVKRPTGPTPISKAIQYVADFLSTFEKLVKAHKGLDEGLKRELINELYKRFWTKLPIAQAQVAEFERSSRLDLAINLLLDFLGKFEVKLPEEDRAKLDKAGQLGATLNRPLSEQEMLTVLVELWESMTPAERQSSFATSAPEFHNYLSTSTDSKRECLRRPDCKRFFTRIVKSWFILPKLRQQGVQQIQAQIQSSALQELNSSIQAAAAQATDGLGKRIGEEIIKELDKEYAKYSGIRANFGHFAKEELQKWFESTYQRSTLPALEDGSLVLGPKLTAKKVSAAITFNPEVFGDALASSEILLSGKADMQTELFAWTKINQMLANGGFKTSNGGSYKTLVRMRDGKATPLNVEKEVKTGTPLGYQVGAPIIGFSTQGSSAPIMDNKDHVAMMRGFRQFINLFADWKPSLWKNIVKDINVKDMLSSLENDALNAQPIPADGMLALAVGNYTSFIANMAGAGSPLFFHCPAGINAWMSKGQKCEDKTTLVSFNVNRNTAVIRTIDHAEFLLEIIAFRDAIDGLVKTKSRYLVEKRKGKKSGVEELRDVKHPKDQLKDLIMGLSNFLSHILITEEGRFVESYNIGSRVGTEGKLSLKTSLRAIEALIRASEVLGLDIYKDTARGAFYYLNKHAFDSDKQFFRVANGSPKLSTRIMALNTLNLLIPSEPDATTAEQMRELKSIWQKAIQKEIAK